MNPDFPSTLPPCPVASGIIRRLAEAGPDFVQRVFAMEKARCDICGHVNDIPRHYGDWQCSQCQQGYEYEEGHAIKLTDAQWKLLRDCRWIPVSERLPECSADGDMESVLGYYPEFPPAILLVWYTGHRWEDGDGSGMRMKAPTYWMPLPEPPSA